MNKKRFIIITVVLGILLGLVVIGRVIKNKADVEDSTLKMFSQDYKGIQPDACKVTDINIIDDGEGGDFSPDGEKLVYDGNRWHQLTNMGEGQASPDNPTGILLPQFSSDGKKVFWSERIGDAKPAETSHLAKWRLATLDFVDDMNGPRLLNKHSFSPGNGTFFESHTFHPLYNNLLLFSSDIDKSKPYPGNIIDIFKYNFATGKSINLTSSDDEWDEHAIFSPSGNKIVWSSSSFYQDYNPSDTIPIFHIPKNLKLEVYLMDADGKNKVQLTHFNTPGYKGYHKQSTTGLPHAWSPDGTKLSGTQQLKFPDRRIWMLTFQGACGKI